MKPLLCHSAPLCAVKYTEMLFSRQGMFIYVYLMEATPVKRYQITAAAHCGFFKSYGAAGSWHSPAKSANFGRLQKKVALPPNTSVFRTRPHT